MGFEGSKEETAGAHAARAQAVQRGRMVRAELAATKAAQEAAEAEALGHERALGEARGVLAAARGRAAEAGARADGLAAQVAAFVEKTSP